MADESFKEFVMDQLRALPELRVKKMFGGHGLYKGERFFGILMEGRLYFKTDTQSRAAYRKRGMIPFAYNKGKQIISMNYFEVPPEILEDRDELAVWANRAVEASGESEDRESKSTSATVRGNRRPRKRRA